MSAYPNPYRKIIEEGLPEAPSNWPYAEREAWKGGYYACMEKIRKALEGNRHNGDSHS